MHRRYSNYYYYYIIIIIIIIIIISSSIIICLHPCLTRHRPAFNNEDDGKYVSYLLLNCMSPKNSYCNLGMFSFKQFVHSCPIASHIIFKSKRFEIAAHGTHFVICTPLHASPGVSSCCAGGLIFCYSTCNIIFLYLFPASSSVGCCPVQVQPESLTLGACIICSKLHPRGRRCGCLVTVLPALRESILSIPASCRTTYQ